jgi:hypothetical protein
MPAGLSHWAWAARPANFARVWHGGLPVAKLLTMCAALSTSGGFCGGSFDASPSRPGDVRLCHAGLHRFVWDGHSWDLDLSFDPDAVAPDATAPDAAGPGAAGRTMVGQPGCHG